MKKILSQTQAEAIYSAFKTLDAVHMRGCDMRFTKAIVTCDFNGTIRVMGTEVVDDERYVDLSGFATAYGLA